MKIEVSWRELERLVIGGDDLAKTLAKNAIAVLGRERSAPLVAALAAGSIPEIVPNLQESQGKIA